MTIDETVQMIERLLPQGHVTKIQKIVLQQTWEGRSYLEIAREFGYDAGYIKDTGAKLWQQISAALGKKVTKQNFKGVVNRAVWREKSGQQTLNRITQTAIGGDDAIDVAIFANRSHELTTLQTQIVQDWCRLDTLIGMGSTGKISLSAKLGEEIQGESESLNWRSLRNAQSIDELLTTLIQVFPQRQDIELPDSVSDRLSRLIELLERDIVGFKRDRRCKDCTAIVRQDTARK